MKLTISLLKHLGCTCLVALPVGGYNCCLSKFSYIYIRISVTFRHNIFDQKVSWKEKMKKTGKVWVRGDAKTRLRKNEAGVDAKESQPRRFRGVFCMRYD